MNGLINKRIKTLISCTLIFVFIFISLSSGAFATPPNNSFGLNMKKIDKNKRIKPKNILPKAKDKPVELKKRRTRHSKEYINPDGTFTTQIFKKTIHFKDNLGQLKRIDNTLVEIDKEGYNYENKENDFKVKFAPNNKSDKLVRFSIDEDHWLEFAPKDKFNNSGKVDKTSIEYKNFKPHMDLKYFIDNIKLKEEIILHSYPDTNTFIFNFKSKGLIFEKDDEGILWALDKKTKEKVFYFQKSFALDANENITYDAQLDTLNEQGKEKLVLTVNDKWLKNAKYPVIIDPTIETSTDKNSADTYVASHSTKADSNFYLSNYLHVGYLENYDKIRSFIRFKYLPSLAPGAKIKNAYLSTYMYLGSSGTTTVDVCEITESWDSSTTTWNNQPSFDDANPLVSGYTSTPNTVWEFDIESLVKKWYKGEKENYGVTLKATD